MFQTTNQLYIIIFPFITVKSHTCRSLHPETVLFVHVLNGQLAWTSLAQRTRATVKLHGVSIGFKQHS